MMVYHSFFNDQLEVIQQFSSILEDLISRYCELSVALSRIWRSEKSLAFGGHVLSLLELKLSGVSPIMFIPQESRDFSDLLTTGGSNGNVIGTENLSVI
ncbi:hypothetical protein HM131_15250 [Halobacillus mangrovi]|uniref:Uncharacterized protein n=1 Tax=Halobacillus mangrovi TaxID=402384 RepID=A0A1W5ZXQ5_9BACI|nr:hypothetical protein HM131_15250 [Halobacillus mangrovi]